MVNTAALTEDTSLCLPILGDSVLCTESGCRSATPFLAIVDIRHTHIAHTDRQICSYTLEIKINKSLF